MTVETLLRGKIGGFMGLAALLFSAWGCPTPQPNHPAGPGKGTHGTETVDPKVTLPEGRDAQLAFARNKMKMRDEFASVTQAVEAYRRIVAHGTPSADILAEALQASCRAAEIAESDAAVAHYVQLTVAWADKGMQAFPKRVEFPYRKAVAIGIQTERVSKNALDRVRELEKLLLTAQKLDERYDHAGPLRLLGAVYVKAPEVGSIGDPDKGVKLLERAVSLFSDYPPNHFFLGEGYFKQEEFDKAAKEFKTVLDAGSLPDYSDRDAKWFKERAENYLKKIRRRNAGGDV